MFFSSCFFAAFFIATQVIYTIGFILCIVGMILLIAVLVRGPNPGMLFALGALFILAGKSSHLLNCCSIVNERPNSYTLSTTHSAIQYAASSNINAITYSSTPVQTANDSYPIQYVCLNVESLQKWHFSTSCGTRYGAESMQ